MEPSLSELRAEYSLGRQERLDRVLESRRLRALGQRTRAAAQHCRATTRRHHRRAVEVRDETRRSRRAFFGPVYAMAEVAVAGQVVIATDEVLLREGLAGVLTRSGYVVVGQMGDGMKLIDLVREHAPDIAIVDAQMACIETNGNLTAAHQIREEFPGTKLLVLTSQVDTDYALDLLSEDGVGYLIKGRITDAVEFVSAVARILDGGSVIDPDAVQTLLKNRFRRGGRLMPLSTRERQVLALAAEGRSNGGIARRLVITEATVEQHLKSVYRKLGLKDRPDDHRRVLAALTFLDAG